MRVEELNAFVFLSLQPNFALSFFQSGFFVFRIINVNRNNKALHFYERKGMKKLREGDFAIGNGYYMNDYIMGLEIK